MELAKISKKGRLIVPRSVLSAAGIAEGSLVAFEATADGAIVMRQVAVYPMESYSEERVREFEEANTIPLATERRIKGSLKKKPAKR
jgi:bifunctional DNA-binding transcriptional regulator/antitoxin component of YhaV-PrlF toxin-antitoxin module